MKRMNQLYARACGLFAVMVALGSNLALAAPIPETGWDMPVDVSKDGHRITWLIDITMVFLVVLFVIMVIWMAIPWFKHTGDFVADYDHGHSKHHIMVAFGLSTVIFIIVDGNLWYNSVKDLNEVFWNFEEVDKNPDTVKIEINAHQWAWDARYAGADGEFNTPDDIITLNDIRVPVDTPVLIQLAAVDVIHAFNLPNLRIKQDAVPGYVSPLWFEATQTGEFDISCAEMCGAHHYKMKGMLTILSKDDYAYWAEQSSTRAELAYNPDDIDGHWGWTWEEM